MTKKKRKSSRKRMASRNHTRTKTSKADRAMFFQMMARNSVNPFGGF